MREFKDVVIQDNLISMDKKYRTGDGRSVRVLCINREQKEYPVVALIMNKKTECLASYTKKGLYYSTERNYNIDLIEIKPIPDKALVRCWDNKGSDFIRHEKFYDAINNCTFFASGKRHGGSFDNYEIIGPEPEWAKEARKVLKD